MLCNQTVSLQLHYVAAFGEGVNIPQLLIFQTHQFSLEIASYYFFSTPWHSVVSAITNWMDMHSTHWDINPTSLFLAKPPPLNQQTVQVPLFRQSSPIYWFFVTLPKSPIFQ